MSEVETQREYLVKVGQRPWGEYIVLENEDNHKVKRIIVNPGQRLSLQLHHKRDEHWFILKGVAKVTLNGKELIINEGLFIDIPRRCEHRIENYSQTQTLEFIEVQTGDYFGEDDIVRLQDDYLRSS